jgi:hypothetical protein
MLIKYAPKNGARIKIVPLIQAGQKKAVRSQALFFPGANEVADDEWELMRPHIEGELKAGILTTLERTAKGKGGAAETLLMRSLADLPTAAAEDFVSQCVNPDVLRKWYREETRPSTRLRVVRRAEELKIELAFEGGRGTDELEEEAPQEVKDADGAKAGQKD